MDLAIHQSLVHSVGIVGRTCGAPRNGAMVGLRHPLASLFYPMRADDRDERPNQGAVRTGRSVGTAGGSLRTCKTPRTPWRTSGKRLRFAGFPCAALRGFQRPSA